MAVSRKDAKSERLIREAFLRTLREFGERGSRYPVLEPRSDDEMLGYEEMLYKTAEDKRC